MSFGFFLGLLILIEIEIFICFFLYSSMFSLFISLVLSSVQIQSMTSLTPVGTRWVSRWASLADNYTDSGPASGLFDIPAQVDLASGGMRNQFSFFCPFFLFACTFSILICTVMNY